MIPIPRRSFLKGIGSVAAAPLLGATFPPVARAAGAVAAPAPAMIPGQCPIATSATLAMANLESSRARSWQMLGLQPEQPGTILRIIEAEQYRDQFLGDVTALDRLAWLLASMSDKELYAGSSLDAARIASTLHRFSEAERYLVGAERLAVPEPDCRRVRQTLEQARGVNVPDTLAARREAALATGALQDLVLLAALLAELGEYEEADRLYTQALHAYRSVSPFPLAWTCFQLGVLWGETVPAPDPVRAAVYYRQAIRFLPQYTRARVHLAEILLDAGLAGDAEAVLESVAASEDPEVPWRLADVLDAQNRSAEAAVQRDRARTSFEALLVSHELAFADHAAVFYLGAGADPARADQLAHRNLENRPTLRAFELAQAAALASGQDQAASDLRGRAKTMWGTTPAFRHSPLAGPAA